MGSDCVAVPKNLCAMAYDEGRCQGWKLEIHEGDIQTRDLEIQQGDPTHSLYRDKIESVSVRAGYTLTGFEDNWSFTIQAGIEDKHITLDNKDDLEYFDEGIQPISCTCRG